MADDGRKLESGSGEDGGEGKTETPPPPSTIPTETTGQEGEETSGAEETGGGADSGPEPWSSREAPIDSDAEQQRKEPNLFEEGSVAGESKKHNMSEASSSKDGEKQAQKLDDVGEQSILGEGDLPPPPVPEAALESSAEFESEFLEMLDEEESGTEAEKPEDTEKNLGLSIVHTDEFEGEVFYGAYNKMNNLLDADEQASEEAFLKRYAEEYGEDDEDVPIEPEPVTLSVHSLNEMIRLLQSQNEEQPGEGECDSASTVTDIPSGSDWAEEKSESKEVDIVTGEEEDMIVLGPSHPKMQRFQDALKKHLLRQIYLTECEERDLTCEVRNRKKEREELGTQLYNLQYELSRQTEYLEKQEKELETMTEKRLNVEKAAEEMRGVHAKLQDEIKVEIEEERAIMQMVKEMDMMEWCVRRAAQEYDGDLQISHKVDEQYQKLRNSTEIEKRDQDFYLDRIMTHVQTMEQANDGIQRQINAHLDEQRDLNNFIAEAGTEIEALQMEKVHLQRAWNETISVVRARDEALTAARNTLNASKEECRNKENDLRSIMRQITKEQEKHEELTILVKRRKMEERHLKSQLNLLAGNCAELEATLQTLQTIKAQVEHEFRRAENDMISYEKEIDPPRRRIESLNIEKAKLEDEILFAIQEQTALDKTAQGIARKIQMSRDRTRTVEGEIAKVENELTVITCTCEKLRTELLKKNTALEELEKKLVTQEKVLQAQTSDMKHSDKQIQKKSSEIEMLTRRLNKLIDEHGGTETGPLEKEIEELERQISGHRTTCVELQENWLKLQDDLVVLTTKRDEILAENDLIRKEAFIMDRKRQRVEAENDAKRAEIQNLTKAIDVLRNEVQLMNSKLYEGKEEQEQMDKENILLQNELVHLLKDAEMEAYELQDEIANLESEKDKLTASLADAHEQCLLWEKKVKLARELKDSIKKEQETSTSALKLAIHHMQVRFSELKRAQEKIMQDLEGCVDKRERIIQEADLNLKRSNIHPRKIKLNIQRDETNLQEKNKQLIKEAMDAEEEVKNMENRVVQLEARIKCETESLRSIKAMIEVADKKINEAAIEKHKNLIEILLRQMKYKVLEAVNLNRFNFPADEESLLEELAEVEKKCYAIVELCDKLLVEFPECELPIKLVKASILPNVH